MFNTLAKKPPQNLSATVPGVIYDLPGVIVMGFDKRGTEIPCPHQNKVLMWHEKKSEVRR